MVVLLMPEATRSRWVRREIEYVLGEKRYSRRLIPALVGAPADFPQEDIPWILWRFQMIKLTEYDQGEASPCDFCCTHSLHERKKIKKRHLHRYGSRSPRYSSPNTRRDRATLQVLSASGVPTI